MRMGGCSSSKPPGGSVAEPCQRFRGGIVRHTDMRAQQQIPCTNATAAPTGDKLQQLDALFGCKVRDNGPKVLDGAAVHLHNSSAAEILGVVVLESADEQLWQSSGQRGGEEGLGSTSWQVAEWGSLPLPTSSSCSSNMASMSSGTSSCRPLRKCLSSAATLLCSLYSASSDKYRR